MKIVCRQFSNVTQSSLKEAAEQKPGAGSKRDTRSRRTEILRALGKSTTESDVTEGGHQCSSLEYNYCCYLLHFAWGIAEAKCILVTAVCVCLSVCPSPHSHTTGQTGCYSGNGRGAL